jgi:hypothetical protein
VVSTTGQEPEGLWFSYPEYLAFARDAPALRDVVAVGGRGVSFVSGDEKQLLLMNLVRTSVPASSRCTAKACRKASSHYS